MTKKSILRLLQASLMCCLAVLFTACDDVFGNEDNPMSAYLSMSDKPVTIKAGDTYRRKAVSVTSAVVEYSSSDTNVATVDGEGVVTAIAEGTATITATATGYSSQNGKKIYQPASVSYVVTVVSATVPATSLTLNKTTEVLAKNGDALTITATVTPSDATFTWESSDANVATVENGVVTPVGAGIATITAKSGDVKATCEVFVGNPVDLGASAYEAKNYDILKGNMGANSLTIPAGFKVAFDGLATTGGITCNGDATIVLIKETENTISAATTAIQAGPANTTLTLSGEGTLNATSSGVSYACIGSQKQGAAGNIVIKGGIINATAAGYAAAIGAGNGGSCQDITIQGGTVTARSGDYGAGIGTGANGWGATACRDITITGGIVNAYGGDYGAGIGAGGANYYNYAINCHDITITGGTVNANGGQYGAGIGTGIRVYNNGPCPTCGDIIISGGTITATKGSNATWDVGLGFLNYSVVSGTVSVTVTVKDKNGNDASIYGVAP